MVARRYPKPYKEGPRRQVTIPWKRRVLAQLEKNAQNGHAPANREQLNKLIEAKKGSVNKLLDLDREPPQLTSTYADEITALLKVAPPLVETDEDNDLELARDVQILRSLEPGFRRSLMETAAAGPKKR